MIEDPAEIAAMATEYISSIDNLHQEVQHTLKEIEHKDAKLQELIPKIASREAQLRDLLARTGTGSNQGPVNPGLILSEADRVKAEKLADRIRADYARADEISSQKEALSKHIWRNACKHQRRLQDELAKISPALIQSVSANNAPGGSVAQPPPVSALPATLTGLGLPGRATEDAVPGQKRKIPSAGFVPGSQRALGGSATSKLSRNSPADRASPSPAPGATTPLHAVNARHATPGGPRRGGGALGAGMGRSRGGGHAATARKSLSVTLGRAPPSAGGAAAAATGDEEEGEEGEGAEGDSTLYCSCQRVSFGEMIACDSGFCPFEWFHLPCVGVKPPLPNTWYCEDCKEKMERDRDAAKELKERKKQQRKRVATSASAPGAGGAASKSSSSSATAAAAATASAT